MTWIFLTSMLDHAGIAGQLHNSSELSRLVGVACSCRSCYSKSPLPGQPQARHVIKKEDNHCNKPGTIWLSMEKPVVWGTYISDISGNLHLRVLFLNCITNHHQKIGDPNCVRSASSGQQRILSHFEETARILEKRKDRERREAAFFHFSQAFHTFIYFYYIIICTSCTSTFNSFLTSMTNIDQHLFVVVFLGTSHPSDRQTRLQSWQRKSRRPRKPRVLRLVTLCVQQRGKSETNEQWLLNPCWLMISSGIILPFIYWVFNNPIGESHS